ncbi:unnamed protein product (macronuclear) [Paramecium tetraurelia]|uniref:Uncharacterized protein n=1 Tax=Paramecium tetraurelia TaxID=5888 RepID=A0DMY4_PARTE|nr:uncharacterized protein GSPATT00018606001 [Paramecium tetraurelia]CAK84401.1 unnamed protein product [Paramecium tetraurelia]|eukprot:XP_001451798.1 hypothetical protein (macronuclear) [Paramecium tetraurelia strain d4-2]
MAQNQQSTRKVSFFEKYFCCGNTQEVQEPNTTNQMYNTVNEYLKINQKNPSLYILQEFDGVYYDRSKKIKTIHPLKDISINNVITERTQHSCPICFCYFNCRFCSYNSYIGIKLLHELHLSYLCIRIQKPQMPFLSK